MIFILMLLPALTLRAQAAATPALEQELAARLPAYQVQWLEADGARFLSLWLREQTGDAEGAALLVIEPGRHADAPGIARLRRDLPAHRWHTLSVALPLPIPGIAPAAGENGAAGDETAQDNEGSKSAAGGGGNAPRIDTTVGWLREQGIFNLVVVAQGKAAWPVIDYFSSGRGSTSPPQGLVLIDPQTNDTRTPREMVETLAKIDVPVLDLVPTGEARAYEAAAERRAVSRRLPGDRYTQLMIPGADTAAGQQRMLTRIRAWLERHAAGDEKQKRRVQP